MVGGKVWGVEVRCGKEESALCTSSRQILA